MPPPSPLKGELPGYVWDTRLRGGRYRIRNDDGTLGRIVSHRTIGTHVREMYASTTEQMAALGRAVASGAIPPSLFQRSMMDLMRNLHLSTGALGMGGWRQVDNRFYGRTGNILRNEYRYLARFVRDIQSGGLTVLDIEARATLYADNAYARYWAEVDRRMKRIDARERVITMGDDRTCPICLDAEAEGWSPAGTHKIALHPRCRCIKDYDTRRTT